MAIEYGFDIGLLTNTGNLFPEYISNNSWVLYHCTSLFSGEEIESVGLKTNIDIIDIQDIVLLISILNKLGITSNESGYGVLHNHITYHHSIVIRVKPISFWPVSCKCLLYSSKEYWGGQVVRAIRQAISFIDRLIANPIDIPESVINEVIELRSNQQIEIMTNKSFGYQKDGNKGLIYAVEFNIADIELFKLNEKLTLYYHHDISIERIIAKITIPDTRFDTNFINNVFKEKTDNLFENQGSLLYNFVEE